MITLSEFRARKERLALAARPFRLRCQVCLQPAFSCYCNSIERFDPNIEFVLLIHPVEARRRIATGRMSFLSLENARMFTGAEFQNHKEIGEILKEPENCCMVLWPGPQSVNLSGLGSQKLHEMFHPQKHLVIFVIDGTWATAKKMLRQSPELGGLPQICFTPPSPSNFRVRQQPAKDCYSTIEAVHHTIELIGPARGFQTSLRRHDSLLGVFDRMVEHQLAFVLRGRENPQFSHFRAHRQRAILQT